MKSTCENNASWAASEDRDAAAGYAQLRLKDQQGREAQAKKQPALMQKPADNYREHAIPVSTEARDEGFHMHARFLGGRNNHEDY